MKTIKELEAEEIHNGSWYDGYKRCREDILKLIDEWRNELRNKHTSSGYFTKEDFEELKSKIQG